MTKLFICNNARPDGGPSDLEEVLDACGTSRFCVASSPTSGPPVPWGSADAASMAPSSSRMIAAGGASGTSLMSTTRPTTTPTSGQPISGPTSSPVTASSCRRRQPLSK